MKRSEINQQLRETIQFFKSWNVYLPPWAYWGPRDWKDKGSQMARIVEYRLGWDITDFGSGRFSKVGLINFNARNGTLSDARKTYCEKIIVVGEGQVTPLHTHVQKREDIINRGGGNLVLQLQMGDFEGKLNSEDIEVEIDGIVRRVNCGGTVSLEPGQSIFLEPGTYHAFWGEPGKGPVLVGEVSTVNDDTADNIFSPTIPRFPRIEEDDDPLHLLVNDYSKYL